MIILTKDRLVGYVYDELMLGHSDPNDPLGPECPERIEFIYKFLSQQIFFNDMIKIQCREATFNELKLAHDISYLNELDLYLGPKSNKQTRRQFTLECDSIFTNSKTLAAAKMAAGSTLQLCHELHIGQIDSGIAIVRPPGHHAAKYKASGFCFYNNIAISAKYLASLNHQVLIFDFDIHQGDGTLNIVYGDNRILFFSLHRNDYGSFYPGNGDSDNNDNCTKLGLNGYIGDDEYINAFTNHLLPQLNDFKPTIILISAGFDGLEGDPIGKSHLTYNCYRQMIKILKSYCPKIILVLEGGYNLIKTAEAFIECTKELIVNN